jgi:hypothetical protein
LHKARGSNRIGESVQKRQRPAGILCIKEKNLEIYHISNNSYNPNNMNVSPYEKKKKLTTYGSYWVQPQNHLPRFSSVHKVFNGVVKPQYLQTKDPILHPTKEEPKMTSSLFIIGTQKSAFLFFLPKTNQAVIE